MPIALSFTRVMTWPAGALSLTRVDVNRHFVVPPTGVYLATFDRTLPNT
jgi:hypothetical protein